MAIRKIDAMHRYYGYGSGLCGDCNHFCEKLRDRKYFKCLVYGDTPSEASDWRKSYIACGLIGKPFPEGDIRIIKRIIPERKEEDQIPGQIEMEL